MLLFRTNFDVRLSMREEPEGRNLQASIMMTECLMIEGGAHWPISSRIQLHTEESRIDRTPQSKTVYEAHPLTR